jgi:succinate-acetate transporter protein
MNRVIVGGEGATAINPDVESDFPSRSRVSEIVGTAGHDGSTVGMPLLVAGACAFALGVTGYAPVGALVPVLVVVVIGETVAARLAFRSRDAGLGGLFTGFAGFWLTYSCLVLGLSHNWFGIDPADTSRAIAVFLISWVAAALMLTLAALAQPIAYFLLLLLLDVALVLLLIGIRLGSPGLFTAAAVALFVMSALAAYICLAATGPAPIRRVLPLGRPLVGAGVDDSVAAAPSEDTKPQTGTDDIPSNASCAARIATNGSVSEESEAVTSV